MRLSGWCTVVLTTTACVVASMSPAVAQLVPANVGNAAGNPAPYFTAAFWGQQPAPIGGHPAQPAMASMPMYPGMPPVYSPQAAGVLPAQAMPAAYMQPMPGQLPPGYSVMPASGCVGCDGGAYETCGNGCNGCNQCSPCGGCGGMGCGACGGLGYCESCGPDGSGGCCNPRWFDLYVEALYLRRDEVCRNTDIASDGVAGPIILSTDDLQFDDRKFAWRITGTYLVGTGSNLELSYFGVSDFTAGASVTDAGNNIYSAISGFGILPPGGYVESDQVAEYQLQYKSKLNSLELNLRSRWVSQGCHFHGSMLWGVRLARLDETMLQLTEAVAHDDPLTIPVDPLERGPGQMSYTNRMINDMVGFQTGGDLWVCLFPGFLVGGEAKAGIYGNRLEQQNTIVATTQPNLYEEADTNACSGIFEVRGMAVFRVTPRITIRGGYELLFIDGVGLAGENVNVDPPFEGTNRVLSINANGNAFYHGVNGGIEWTW